jgi:hypothetical protein
MKKIAIFMMLFISVMASAQADTKPKNIIILFADGTTNSQYEFGRYSSALLRQQSFAVTDVVMALADYKHSFMESCHRIQPNLLAIPYIAGSALFVHLQYWDLSEQGA